MVGGRVTKVHAVLGKPKKMGYFALLCSLFPSTFIPKLSFTAFWCTCPKSFRRG